MQTLIGPRDVASAEPNPNRSVGHLLQTRVANHLAVPAIRPGNDEVRHAFPTCAVSRAGQAHAALLLPVATGVQHPPQAARGPYGRLAESVFVERSRSAGFENRIRAQLLPSDAVGGTRDSEALAA